MAVYLKQGDTAPLLERTLFLYGSPVDITGYQSVTFRMQNEYENVIIEDDTSGNVTVENAADGKVSYTWQPDDTDEVGHYEAEFEVVFGDGSVVSFPNRESINVVINE